VNLPEMEENVDGVSLAINKGKIQNFNSFRKEKFPPSWSPTLQKKVLIQNVDMLQLHSFIIIICLLILKKTFKISISNKRVESNKPNQVVREL